MADDDDDDDDNDNDALARVSNDRQWLMMVSNNNVDNIMMDAPSSADGPSCFR
jgi:hypothetical protein